MQVAMAGDERVARLGCDQSGELAQPVRSARDAAQGARGASAVSASWSQVAGSGTVSYQGSASAQGGNAQACSRPSKRPTGAATLASPRSTGAPSIHR